MSRHKQGSTAAAQSARVAATPRDASEPPEQEIRDRAYAIFLARQDGPGDALSDWLAAERRLRTERSAVEPTRIMPLAPIVRPEADAARSGTAPIEFRDSLECVKLPALRSLVSAGADNN